MRVLFLYVSTNMCRDGDLWFYDEGLASAVAVLRERGHECALRLVGEKASEAEVVRWVEAERAASTLLVFLTSIHFSAYAHDIPNTFAQVQGLKQRTGLPVMFVGLWATLNAEALLEHPGIDMVGRGEMDHALADVCDALDRGAGADGIPNVWTRAQRAPMRPLVEDLDDLPLPARDLLPVHALANEADGILTVVGSRGCPMSCEFCTHVVLRKAYGGVSPARYLRMKSVGYVLREVRAARAATPGIWGVYFHDDMFMLSREWRAEFLRRYPREVGLPFGCNLVIEQVRPDLIAELAAAGCSHVLVGIESGSEKMRTQVFDKPLRDEAIEAALALCRHHGIFVKFYALIGAPTETRRDVVESFKGFARYCADMVQVQVWMAHETSDLLELDRRAADVARRQYDPRGDRAALRLKFYFHYFQRYVALYHVLAGETQARWRARLVRALVTLSVLLPWAPELLLVRGWEGERRWPHRLRGLAALSLWLLGSFGRRLRRDVIALEDRLTGDYLRPEGIDVAAERWSGRARRDGRRRRVAVGA